MKDSHELQLIALVLIFISPYLLISAMLEASIWISSKSWHGRLVATVKEIKRVWHFRGRTYYKEWFEIPIITYQVGDTIYTEEYSHAEEREGVYTVGQEIPIHYNEENPKEFIIEGEYPDSDRFSCLIMCICIAVLCFAVYCFVNYHPGAH